MKKSTKRNAKKSQPPVLFQLCVKNIGSVSQVEKILQSLSKKISEVHSGVSGKIALVFGQTDKQTFERVFQTKLSLIRKTFLNRNKGLKSFSKWEFKRSAIIPDELAVFVDKIEMQLFSVLTD